MQAGGADASRVEGVPLVSAVAKPFGFFARRPAAEWAADARWFGLAGLLLFKLVRKTVTPYRIAIGKVNIDDADALGDYLQEPRMAVGIVADESLCNRPQFRSGVYPAEHLTDKRIVFKITQTSAQEWTSR